MPPFALFASELLMAAAAGREAPWLLLALLPGLLLAGLALLAAMQRLCFGTATQGEAAGLATLAPLWVHLFLAMAVALALPARLAAMLLEAARMLR
jgi:hydrogenase-4 component F